MILVPTLFYAFQVLIFGEKVGEGVGKTRKEAQCLAADTSLRNLAGEVMSVSPFCLFTVGFTNM